MQIVYEKRESTAQQMHHALGEWMLAHMSDSWDDISHYHCHYGNIEEQILCCRGDNANIAEFKIVTEHYYRRREVYYMSDSRVQYHYTIKD